MRKVAVILSGCGYQDGGEIQETVLSFLVLEQLGIAWEALTLNKAQRKVVNHRTGAVVEEHRNLLDESARISRGNIAELRDKSASDFDAVIIPGGFGAALNLCDFALSGADMTVEDELRDFLVDVHKQGKPIGAICIAPVILAKVFGELKPKLTVGHDTDVGAAMKSWGAEPVDCPVDDCIIDKKHGFVTTPAYMLGPSILGVEKGIRKLVESVVNWGGDS